VLPVCFTPICNYKQTGTPIVCNKKTEICTRKVVSEEEEMTKADYVRVFAEVAKEHYSEKEGEVDGLLDHIYGYPKIKNYTLVE
jgi:hypothetical protein